MDRLESVVREGEVAENLVLLLQGGIGTTDKLLRQASLLARTVVISA